MNEPIISPWLIYLIDILAPINAVGMIFSILGCAVSFMGLLICAIEEYERPPVLKVFYAMAVVGILISVFVPRKETVYKMLVAQHITVDNINLAGETADKTIDYLIEKIAKAVKSMEGEK